MCAKNQRYKDKSNLAPAFEWLNSAKEAFVQSFNLICSVLKSNHFLILFSQVFFDYTESSWLHVGFVW